MKQTFDEFIGSRSEKWPIANHKCGKKIEKKQFLIDVENMKHANDKFKNRGLKIWPNAVCRDFR
jgi:hypothetical protein